MILHCCDKFKKHFIRIIVPISQEVRQETRAVGGITFSEKNGRAESA